MSHCQDIRPLLDDWLDESLNAEARIRVDEHLLECAECTRLVDETRALLARAAALPRSIDPRADLWPGILDGIEDSKFLRPRFGGLGGGRGRGLLLAAAGLLLIVASSGLTALFLGRNPVEPAMPAAATVAWQEFEAAEREYQKVTDQLLAALEERRGELSDETIAIVETNLELIDTAIRESRAALEQDPANAGLANKLTDIYRKRVDFLQAMNRL